MIIFPIPAADEFSIKMCQGINFFPEIETLGLIASRIMRPLANQSRESPSGERECGWYLDTGTQGGAHSSLAPLGRPDSENHIALQLSHRDFGAFDFAPWQLKRPSYTRELILCSSVMWEATTTSDWKAKSCGRKAASLQVQPPRVVGLLLLWGFRRHRSSFKGERESTFQGCLIMQIKKKSTIIC